MLKSIAHIFFDTPKRVLLNYFRIGLLVVLPFIITFYVVMFVYDLLKGILNSSFVAVFQGVLGKDVLDYRALANSDILFLISLSIAFVLLVIIGRFSKNFVGNFLIKLSSNIMERIPYVNSVFSSIKGIIDTFKGESKFQGVCLIQYPLKGCYALGFISNEAGDIANNAINDGNQYMNVFIPTTPNPTSGFLLLVKSSEVIVLDVPVPVAIKSLVSAGVLNLNHAEAKIEEEKQKEEEKQQK